MTESAARKHPAHFKPGQSGNPAGRPKGSRHKYSIAVESLLDGEGEKLTRKAIELAMAGDVTALRLCLERISPPRKGRRIALDVGPIEGLTGLANAQIAVVSAMTRGELSAEEAASVAGVIELTGAAIERRDLESRIAALETK